MRFCDAPIPTHHYRKSISACKTPDPDCISARRTETKLDRIQKQPVDVQPKRESTDRSSTANVSINSERDTSNHDRRRCDHVRNTCGSSIRQNCFQTSRCRREQRRRGSSHARRFETARLNKQIEHRQGWTRTSRVSEQERRRLRLVAETRAGRWRRWQSQSDSTTSRKITAAFNHSRCDTNSASTQSAITSRCRHRYRPGIVEGSQSSCLRRSEIEV